MSPPTPEYTRPIAYCGVFANEDDNRLSIYMPTSTRIGSQRTDAIHNSKVDRF